MRFSSLSSIRLSAESAKTTTTIVASVLASVPSSGVLIRKPASPTNATTGREGQAIPIPIELGIAKPMVARPLEQKKAIGSDACQSAATGSMWAPESIAAIAVRWRGFARDLDDARRCYPIAPMSVCDRLAEQVVHSSSRARGPRQSQESGASLATCASASNELASGPTTLTAGRIRGRSAGVSRRSTTGVSRSQSRGRSSTGSRPTLMIRSVLASSRRSSVPFVNSPAARGWSSGRLPLPRYVVSHGGGERLGEPCQRARRHVGTALGSGQENGAGRALE